MGNRYKYTVDYSAKHRGVSGSCTLLSVHHPNEIKFVVDCGLYQGEKNSEALNYRPLDFKPKNVDFAILTHNHADHTGRLPLLYKEGFAGKIYTTVDTARMIPIALKDNEKIMQINAKKDNKKALYDCNDTDEALENVVPCEYGETVMPCSNVKVTFFKNGHIIGASIVLVQILCEEKESINLLFTGDYKKDNVFFDVPQLPDWVRGLPLHIMCESTYGDVDSSDVAKPVFMDNVERWLREGKNTVLVLALSNGRFQEIAYRLRQAQGNGIDPSIPIWFDGNLAIKYNNLYKHKLDIKPELKDFMPDGYRYVEAGARRSLMEDTQQKIIVTTSGMGNFGPAQEYIPYFVEKEDTAIHFTCFLSENSLGHHLVSSTECDNVVINSMLKRKKAEIATTGEFSSHAKRDELVGFLSQFEDIRTLLINHGEAETKVNFARYCRNRLQNCKDIVVLGMGDTIRVDRWNVVKTICER